MNKTMKKIGAKLTAVGFAATLLTGVGMVAVAPTAQAATMTQCQLVDAGYGRQIGWTGHRYGALCYFNYSWSEEVFLGYRDGYKFANTSNNKCHLIPWLGFRPYGC